MPFLLKPKKINYIKRLKADIIFLHNQKKEDRNLPIFRKKLIKPYTIKKTRKDGSVFEKPMKGGFIAENFGRKGFISKTKFKKLSAKDENKTFTPMLETPKNVIVKNINKKTRH